MAQGYGPDLRIIIGWMFVLLGGLLTAFGFINPGADAPLTHHNVNLQWGAVQFIFGLIMLGLGYRGQAIARRAERDHPPPSTPVR